MFRAAVESCFICSIVCRLFTKLTATPSARPTLRSSRASSIVITAPRDVPLSSLSCLFRCRCDGGSDLPECNMRRLMRLDEAETNVENQIRRQHSRGWEISVDHNADDESSRVGRLMRQSLSRQFCLRVDGFLHLTKMCWGVS
jgi:hypothetical protein